METKITATELAKSLSDILNRVKYNGERFVIERNGEPIASLAPLGPAKSITLREFAMKLREFPQPDEDFWKDLEAIQASQSKVPPPPWPSS